MQMRYGTLNQFILKCNDVKNSGVPNGTPFQFMLTYIKINYKIILNVSLAQWIERSAPDRKAVGSTPTGNFFIDFLMIL